MTSDVQLIFELSSLVFSEFKCHWDLLGAFSPKVVRVWEYDKDEVWKLIDMETVANTENWDGRQYLGDMNDVVMKTWKPFDVSA